MTKNIYTFLAILTAMLTLSSCQEKQPEFTFDNYEQEFDAKQPFSIKYQYIRLTNTHRGSVLEKIEMANRKAFFELEESVPRSVERCIDLSIEKFREEHNCDKENLGHTVYELIKTAKVNVYDRTLAYTIEGYQYTGGAHGMSWISGTNYSLEDGKVLTLDDFFTAEQQKRLPKILVNLLCWQKGISINDIDKLEQMGYYIEAIVPTDNFIVTSRGIEFLYNPYDIGVYALGKTVIELPFSMTDELFEMYDK